jgi:exonuclease SbcD
MKILHTADWHLGRLLYGQKRYAEFEQFLNWLVSFIDQHQIDVLLVAGDIFDTTTPSNRSQALYYKFLSNVSNTCCKHVVITGGNHDSPTLLNAPKQLLKVLNVHIVGEIAENIADEVIILKNSDGISEAIICAVPYLRDRDVRRVVSGESQEEKSKKLINGIADHYNQVAYIAEEIQTKTGPLPIIGMGHLFTSSERTNNGDGVRELYVGTLAYLDGTMFPTSFDYLALGHLHIAQKVGKNENMRYSGSPIPMGFNEASQSKKVVVVDFDKKTPAITEYEIPCFKELHRIAGSVTEILEKIENLKSQNKSGWLEIELTFGDVVTDLIQQINNVLKDTNLEALLIKNKIIEQRILSQANINETLEDLNPEDVFVRCLDANEVSQEAREHLMFSYNEIVSQIVENDSNA